MLSDEHLRKPQYLSDIQEDLQRKEEHLSKELSVESFPTVVIFAMNLKVILGNIQTDSTYLIYIPLLSLLRSYLLPYCGTVMPLSKGSVEGGRDSITPTISYTFFHTHSNCLK